MASWVYIEVILGVNPPIEFMHAIKDVNRKPEFGLKTENRFSILKTGFRIYFFKIIFSIKNCIMLKRNS